MGTYGERPASLLERVPGAFSGRGDAVQVPRGTSQWREVGAEPGVREAADELDLDLSDELGQLRDGGERAELRVAEGAGEVLGG